MDALFAVGEVLIAALILAAVHFPLETTRSLLNFGIAPAASYARRQKAQTIALEVAHTRERLGYFIDEGRLLLARLRDSAKDAEASRSHARAWSAQVEEFLRSDFGNSYVSRFRARSNGSVGEIAGVPPERLSDWRDLRDSVSSLEAFSAEL